MFGTRRKIQLSQEPPSCRSCIYATINDEYDYVCKFKGNVEAESKCRRYKLDITKATDKRSHISAKNQFNEDTFKL